MSALERLDPEAGPATRATGVTHVLLIVNPGSRAGRQALAPVLAALRAAGASCEVAHTAAPGHATALVREQLDAAPTPFDAVFTLGGDGTAMEVATALAGIANAPPLGIIAVGTANVLARTLGLPMSPAVAVPALLEAEPVTIDLGRIEGGPAFAIGLGIGLDAAMIGGASSGMKRRIGFLAYGWSAFRAGLRLERFHARVTVDGVLHEVETSSVLVANFGTVLGDLVCFGEGIGHRDGLLDVCLYSPRSLPAAGRILWRMVFGGVSNDRCVRTIRGRHIRIETDPPRRMQADGELLGLTPVEIRVAPAAVRVLVPRSTTSRRWRFKHIARTRVRTEPLGYSSP
jgi:YegS/Rv2252/BmrU family lipid kinase